VQWGVNEPSMGAALADPTRKVIRGRHELAVPSDPRGLPTAPELPFGGWKRNSLSPQEGGGCLTTYTTSRAFLTCLSRSVTGALFMATLEPYGIGWSPLRHPYRTAHSPSGGL
jgi:hypothetical protein